MSFTIVGHVRVADGLKVPPAQLWLDADTSDDRPARRIVVDAKGAFRVESRAMDAVRLGLDLWWVRQVELSARTSSEFCRTYALPQDVVVSAGRSVRELTFTVTGDRICD